jgi:hypothetical protein
MESIRHKRGRSLRKIHDKKSIYIDAAWGRSLRKGHDRKSIDVSDARGRSLRKFTEKFTTRILWHIASKLIQGEETTYNFRHLLMGKICGGSGCSKSSEHLDLRDIVVDMTLVL